MVDVVIRAGAGADKGQLTRAMPTIDLIDMAVGDGTFIVDGCKMDRRNRIQSKLPDGV